MRKAGLIGESTCAERGGDRRVIESACQRVSVSAIQRVRESRGECSSAHRVVAAKTLKRLRILVDRGRPQRRDGSIGRIRTRRSIQPQRLIHVDGRSIEVPRLGTEAQDAAWVNQERVRLTQAQDRDVCLGQEGRQSGWKPLPHRLHCVCGEVPFSEGGANARFRIGSCKS